MSVCQAAAAGRSAPFSNFRSTSKTRLICNLTSDEWDGLVTQFDDTYYEQISAFQVAHWGESRIRRIAVKRNDQVIAMALGLVFKVPYLNRGLALVKFAPLWRRKGAPPLTENLGYAIDALIEHFVVREKLSLSILPAADPRFTEIYREELLTKGFRHKPIRESERYLVNTTLLPDRQMASLDKTWRYNLRKSLKQSVTVAEESSDQALSEFAGIFEEMEKRKNYSNASWASFRATISAGCPGSVRPILFLAREGQQAVAGAIVVHVGDTAYYLYGATGGRGTQLMAGYALQWRIIEWLHERRCHWYDLGGGTREDGLIHFKKGLAGKEGSLEAMPGEFTLTRDWVSAALAMGLLAVRRTRLLMRSRIYNAKQTLRALLRKPGSR